MSDLSEEEEKAILESAPVGTWALMLTLAAVFVAGWVVMFAVFLGHGPVH